MEELLLPLAASAACTSQPSLICDHGGPLPTIANAEISSFQPKHGRFCPLAAICNALELSVLLRYITVFCMITSFSVNLGKEVN